MIELEENSKHLLNMKEKIKSLGDSLWHYKAWRKVKIIRSGNIQTRVLEW
jgi:hypothetical protein